ncbi:MAG TPA: hypothetical protein DFI00_03580 [Rhodospirillaceae bacterium]|nr:hypothetical protein [Alphaproteobacteria bacterium]OUT42230.1 MAG: hypothetical protein CBB62_08070 [Micavibrio sp. TMED2]HCI46354.1 hypothetical protein [Rhodospirillaceae bacterium]MAS46143.1 hypothetical protein [Alphaproteobacteria bacterium]MAX95673.1 hypothetical protein [Alphaproteobacteria bacterium]|tara:strand:- start:331 stop:543 length:213 start_codon:yes stop_codon:yes gene_type:complete
MYAEFITALHNTYKFEISCKKFGKSELIQPLMILNLFQAGFGLGLAIAEISLILCSATAMLQRHSWAFPP